MAYRFNGGKGAVTCDHCNIIIDEDLSHDEYMECYGGQKKDWCAKCFHPVNRKKPQEVLDGERIGSASCEDRTVETSSEC